MYLNLSKPKSVLEANPSPDRMLAVECKLAAQMWFYRALNLSLNNNLNNMDKNNIELALNKAAMYENMAHDGRK